MAEGRDRQHWQHTSSVLAMLANVNRGKRGKVYNPADFNPYEKRGGESIPMKEGGFAILRAMYTKHGKP